MRSTMTKYEKETIINFNEEERTAMISTYNRTLLKKLDGYTEQSSEIRKISGDDEFGEYVCPKRWVKVQMPKKYSEERLAALRERMKAMRGTENG